VERGLACTTRRKKPHKKIRKKQEKNVNKTLKKNDQKNVKKFAEKVTPAENFKRITPWTMDTRKITLLLRPDTNFDVEFDIVEEKKEEMHQVRENLRRLGDQKKTPSTPGKINSTVNVWKRKDDCHVLGISTRSKTSFVKPKISLTPGKVNTLKMVFEGTSPLRQQVRNFNSKTNPLTVQAKEQLFVQANRRADVNASLGTAQVRTPGLDGQARTPGNGPTGKIVPYCTAQKGKKER
jgi:hypothetical protein